MAEAIEIYRSKLIHFKCMRLRKTIELTALLCFIATVFLVSFCIKVRSLRGQTEEANFVQEIADQGADKRDSDMRGNL